MVTMCVEIKKMFFVKSHKLKRFCAAFIIDFWCVVSYLNNVCKEAKDVLSEGGLS